MDLAQVRWRVDIAGPTAPDPQGPLPPPTALSEAPILGQEDPLQTLCLGEN